MARRAAELASKPPQRTSSKLVLIGGRASNADMPGSYSLVFADHRGSTVRADRVLEPEDDRRAIEAARRSRVPPVSCRAA
jgi:hypothetical protein